MGRNKHKTRRLEFTDVYKFPLYLFWGKVHSKDGGMAFDFMGPWRDDPDCISLQSYITGSINGKNDYRVEGIFTYRDGEIFLNEESVIMIRGWANLTSPSCLGLDRDEAARIQDEFADYIMIKLQ